MTQPVSAAKIQNMKKEMKINEMEVDRTLAAVAYKSYPGIDDEDKKGLMIYDLLELKSKQPIKMFTRKRLIKFIELLLPGN